MAAVLMAGLNGTCAAMSDAELERLITREIARHYRENWLSLPDSLIVGQRGSGANSASRWGRSLSAPILEAVTNMMKEASEPIVQQQQVQPPKNKD
jgi:hypothetical protein